MVSVGVMDEVQPCHKWPLVHYMSSHVCTPANVQAHIHPRSTDQTVSHVQNTVLRCTACLCMSSHVCTPLTVHAHIHLASPVQDVSHVWNTVLSCTARLCMSAAALCVFSCILYAPTEPVEL